MPRRLLLLLVILAVFAVGCGDDGEVADATDNSDEATSDGAVEGPDEDEGDPVDEVPTTDAPAADVELAASWRGVTEDSIKVGVAAIDFEALANFGVDIDGIDPNLWAPAWAEAFNERGGAHGRTMEVVVSQFLPVGSTESDLTCAELTQDAEVFVVLGSMLGDNPLCVTGLNETPYVGLFGLSQDRLDRSVAPFFASEMAVDAQRTNALNALIEQGTFDGVKLGVYWEEADETLAADVALPLLEEAGVDIVETVVQADFGDDQVAAADSADILFAALAGAGADMYLNISGIVTFNRAVERNQPGVPFVLLNGQITNSAVIATSGYDPAVLADAIGVTASKPTAAEWVDDAGFQQCFDELNAFVDEPFEITEMTDSVIEGLGQSCQGFRLLDHLLVTADPELTPDALVAAADMTGELLLPGMIAGSLGPGKYSVGDAVRYYTYDPDLEFMVPTGEPIDTSG